MGSGPNPAAAVHRDSIDAQLVMGPEYAVVMIDKDVGIAVAIAVLHDHQPQQVNRGVLEWDAILLAEIACAAAKQGSQLSEGPFHAGQYLVRPGSSIEMNAMGQGGGQANGDVNVLAWAPNDHIPYGTAQDNNVIDLIGLQPHQQGR
jgi:hypothetical protein